MENRDAEVAETVGQRTCALDIYIQAPVGSVPVEHLWPPVSEQSHSSQDRFVNLIFHPVFLTGLSRFAGESSSSSSVRLPAPPRPPDPSVSRSRSPGALPLPSLAIFPPLSLFPSLPRAVSSLSSIVFICLAPFPAARVSVALPSLPFALSSLSVCLLPLSSLHLSLFLPLVLSRVRSLSLCSSIRLSRPSLLWNSFFSVRLFLVQLRLCFSFISMFANLSPSLSLFLSIYLAPFHRHRTLTHEISRRFSDGRFIRR